jgi:hypothetical protein
MEIKNNFINVYLNHKSCQLEIFMINPAKIHRFRQWKQKYCSTTSGESHWTHFFEEIA